MRHAPGKAEAAHRDGGGRSAFSSFVLQENQTLQTLI
jgi:hypothetical protein